jgi:TPR repeat protein/serine/threonine protein kinase
MEPDATTPNPVRKAGEYDLLRRLGTGGFGTVFEARHRGTGLPFAVKRLRLTFEDADRFRKEGLYSSRTASQSMHVLGVHSFFQDDAEGEFYLVTDLIRYGDLRQFLDSHPKPLPLPDALLVALGIARGLAAIHDAGIVHFDLKPANILMDRKDGVWIPKISDFGLARSSAGVSIRQVDSVTIGYAAPEQIDLMSDVILGAASDLFAFGMVLYELLTGSRPTSPSTLREYSQWCHARVRPQPPSTLNPALAAFPELNDLVNRLLEFDAESRRITSAECVSVLTNCLHRLTFTDHSTTPNPPPPGSDSDAHRRDRPPSSAPRTAVQRMSTRRVLTVAAVVVVLISVGAIGWRAWQRSRVTDLSSRGIAAFEAGHYEEALPLLTDAGNLGDAAAQATLGRLYLFGRGVPPDYNAAKDWFTRAADQDNPRGYSGLGILLANGWAGPKDLPGAIELFQKAADRDDPAGEANLAMAYFNGDGVGKDPARAIALIRKAADQGYAPAQRTLGWAYASGTGVSKDDKEALRRYRIAADAGDDDAMRRLAVAYADGAGVPKNPAEAVRWYKSAIARWNDDARCGLAGMYLDGTVDVSASGVGPQTASDRQQAARAEALRLYRVAADRKAACGEDGLGYMSWFGYGVPKSYDESLRWYETAAAQGDEFARTTIAKLERAWTTPPLFTAAWRQLSGAERRTEIDWLKQQSVFDRIGTTDVRRMRAVTLDFYNGAVLFELEVGTGADDVAVLDYIKIGNRFVMIDGKSDQIHQLSASAPIRIDTSQRAIAFLRFFMAAVQGEAGNFGVVDDTSGVPWLPSATPANRSQVAALITPLDLSASPSGGWHATSTLLYSRTLFHASLWVKPDGMVQMTDDVPVATAQRVAMEKFNDKGLRVHVRDGA